MAKRKKRGQSIGASGDPGAAFWSARAFRECSRLYIQTVEGRPLAPPSDFTAQRLGEIIASATSLSLSIELYLKALLVITRQRVPREHNLWTLYRNLPETVRQSVEETYDGVPKPPDGITVSTILCIALAPNGFESYQARPLAPPDHSLPALLKRSGDAFSTWRYVYEKGRPDKMVSLKYEFHALGVAAEVLAAHVTVLFEKARTQAENQRPNPGRFAPRTT